MASKMPGKRKRQGVGLEMKTFKGNDKQNYLVFRTPKGSYHVFLEVEAKGSRDALRSSRKRQHAPNMEGPVEVA
jgi:hypothetical protein